MAFTTNILNQLVSISQFNRGQASKIFDRLHSERQIVVLKNNLPTAIIITPEEYSRLVGIEEDHLLFLEATKRVSNEKKQNTLTIETIMTELGISQTDIDNCEEIELE